MIHYCFNTQTGQFVQIATANPEPFDEPWVEITQVAFEYLMSLING